ncbi:uncharacterized protein LOC133324426 [Musca vetustissima]|uniref:uncharacterized protein LOC133324426 n=1 Tax=Musca vetustissima TaxID=27455 RepID=UPI002AB667D2|nr:uncharacterized protein LOC133324426 [Musca vetustissima]
MSNVTNLIGFLNICSVQNELALALVNILRLAREERYYHTIIYASHSEVSSVGNTVDLYDVDKIAKELEIPMLQLKGNASLYLWPYYNRQYFALIPMSGIEGDDKKLLEALWKVLRKSVKTRLLLIFRKNAKDSFIEDILKFCRENKAVNILGVKESLPLENIFYTMDVYPEFKMIQIMATSLTEFVFYKDQVHNLYGYPLRLSINKESRKFYIMNHVNNTYSLGGYVGHFLEEFIRRHNATMTFPNIDDSTAFITDFEEMLSNGTFDISSEPSHNLYNSDRVYSNVFDYMDWCIMVPMEKPIPAYLYYAKVFDITVTILLAVTVVLLSLVISWTIWQESPSGSRFSWNPFNIYIFSGLLGQSFKMEQNFHGIRSAVYMLTCIAGIIINTSYSTYLQTFNSLSPKDKLITTLEDLYKTDMRLLMYTNEYQMLKEFGQDHIYNPVVSITTYQEFIRLRDSYDTKYVYPVPSIQWLLFEEQQKFFAKPRYRLSDICFIKMIGLMIPMQPNSPFEDDINRMIGQVEDTGLLNHWKFLAFLESLQLNRISLLDNSRIVVFEPMG